MADLIIAENIDLVNIADAIREKTGGTDALTLDAMVTEIAGISVSGETPNIEPLEITENGTYTASGDVDGYSPVTVNVSVPDGCIVPSGTLEVTENGEHDVTEYASVNVSVASSGGDTTAEDGIITRTITEYSNDRVTSIGDYAFQGCTRLTSVNLPNVININMYAFRSCSNLTSVDFPLATSVGSYAFQSCAKLTSANFPSATSISSNMFASCPKLTTANFSAATNIVVNAFNGCNSLTALILRSETLCTLSNTNVFTNCYHILGTVNSTYNPDGLKDGYIYVPDTLVDSYKTATNWSTYADQIKPLSEYVEVTE